MKKLARLLGAVLVLGLLFCGTAFAELSGDVNITAKFDDTITVNTAFATSAQVSGDTAVETISTDVTFPSSAESAVILLTFASSDGVTSVDVSFDVVDGVALASKDTVSFDLVTLDSADFCITLTINLSNDTASGDNKLTVRIVNTSTDEAEPFDSATFTFKVDGTGIDPTEYTATSEDYTGDEFMASTDVSEITITIESSSDVLGFAVEGDWEVASDDDENKTLILTVSGDALTDILHVYMASGDASDEANSIDIALTFTLDDNNEAGDTYVLKVSDITLTPANAVSNTAKLISADTDNYSATLNLTNLDSTASGDWGSFADFTVSSDYLGGSFSVTVSTDATLVNVYVKNGTAWGEVDTEEVSGKVITPNTIGTYKVVLSADLVASSDKTVSGDAYFAFDFTVASVDAPAATGDVVVDASNASTDARGGVGNNPVIAGGQKIDTKFLSGTSISQSAFASFFSSATTVTMLSETELAAALETLGLDETYMGNAEEGYKALAFGLPSGFTLTANEKFFVLLTTNENGTANNYLGIGVVPSALNGSSTMVIVFRLLKNPAHTADYMTFPAGNYYVGATNDTASADTSSSTRAVFVTAGGTFNIKSDEATLLQGQTANGTATPYDGDDDDDDDQETSSHGSSSGCDAGFGALALLAVAGALAARKVRK